VARVSLTSKRIEARLVLANCSPDAITTMLPAEAAAHFSAAFAGLASSTSLFTAHFGLKTNPAEFGLTAYSSVYLPSWMTTLGDYARAAALLGEKPNGKLPPITVANYAAIDSRLNNSGPYLVTAVGVDEIGNWRGLSKEDEAARRSVWLDAILGELDRHYPGFAGAVTEKTFMNAASMARYLGTPGGAVYGFDPVPPTASIWHGLPRTPKTPIKGLYLASSFGGSGGFSGAMASGSDAARLAEAFLHRKAN
jgi:all-trans-retinol 13,14-reductase